MDVVCRRNIARVGAGTVGSTRSTDDFWRFQDNSALLLHTLNRIRAGVNVV